MAIASIPSAEVLAAFFGDELLVTPIEAGHINDTFRVDTERGPFILQRLSPIFSARVNEDIAALTAHLRRVGMPTPELLPTRARGLWHEAVDGGIWRLLTFIEGHTYLSATGPQMCQAAGSFLARFHRALSDVNHTFVASRLGVHDTDAHIAGLRAATERHRDHRALGDVERLSQSVFGMLSAVAPMPAMPRRIVHGDPKLSNFLFRHESEVAALVDLDTLCEMELPLELGDALRSWSNSGPGGGEGQAPSFEPTLFAAAIEGYAQGAQGFLTSDEAACIADGTLRISLELSARFLRDALEERYFSWDKKRFAHAFEHHLERAQSQLRFAQSLYAHLPWARGCVARALPAAGAWEPAASLAPASVAAPK